MIGDGSGQGRVERRRVQRTAPAAALLSGLLSGLLAVGCTSDGSGTDDAGRPGDRLYLSIGDSYAAGEQPTADGGLTASRSGFAYLVADRLAADGPVRLVNLGCAGATSAAVMTTHGCPEGALGPGAAPYPRATQADRALAVLKARPNEIRLVTVSIGGNDIEACLQRNDGSPTVIRADCVDRTLTELRGNLRDLLARIRAVTGPDVPIVGLTYPDVYLGSWVHGDPEFARASVALFRDRLNPALRAEYEAAGARFVDVTASTGGYDPLTPDTVLPAYGRVPRPVATICALTHSCASGDVHPTDAGYARIADEVLRAAAPS